MMLGLWLGRICNVRNSWDHIPLAFLSTYMVYEDLCLRYFKGKKDNVFHYVFICQVSDKRNGKQQTGSQTGKTHIPEVKALQGTGETLGILEELEEKTEK